MREIKPTVDVGSFYCPKMRREVDFEKRPMSVTLIYCAHEKEGICHRDKLRENCPPPQKDILCIKVSRS